MAASENTVKVLEYCKNHVGEMITHDTLATALGHTAKQVVPMDNYWTGECGGSVLQRSEPVEVTVTDAEGKPTVKKVRCISCVVE